MDIMHLIMDIIPQIFRRGKRFNSPCTIPDDVLEYPQHCWPWKHCDPVFPCFYGEYVMSQKNNRRRRRRRSRRTAFIIIGAIILFLLLIVLAAILGIHYFYGRSNYVDDASVTLVDDLEKRMQEVDETYEEATLDEEEIKAIRQRQESAWRKALEGKDEEEESEEETETEGADITQAVNMTESAKNTDNSLSERMGNTYNLLLIGTDKRPEWTFYGNSDVMLLVTVNEARNVIYMTSFMRDLYANVPGVGVRKLNSAYAIGAGPLLVETLRSNYGVKIDNYISVNFDSMAAIIDMFGGVDVNVNAAEASYAGIPSAGDNVLTHLNGDQAVRYARIRYIGNADYERTSRQREVLSNLFDRLRNIGVTDYLGLANSILPLTTHNIEMSTLTYLVSKAPSWIRYSSVQLRVPFDNHYFSSNEILVPDFDYTLSTLLGTIY